MFKLYIYMNEVRKKALLSITKKVRKKNYDTEENFEKQVSTWIIIEHKEENTTRTMHKSV